MSNFILIYFVMVRFIDLIYAFRSPILLFKKNPNKWHGHPIENALFGTIQDTGMNSI